MASRAVEELHSTTARTRLNKHWNQAGTNKMHSVASVHSHGGRDNMNQPTTSNRNMAGSTRLRRRLSNIFHHEISEIGLGTGLPDSSGTSRSSHSAICQSPRSQRCLRLLCAL